MKGRPEHPLAPVAPFSLSWPAATRAQALASASHLCALLPGFWGCAHSTVVSYGPSRTIRLRAQPPG